MKGGIRGVDQARNLFLTDYLGKVAKLLRIGYFADAPAALLHVNVEEPRGGQAQDDGVGAELELGEQSRLILADVLRSNLIGTPATLIMFVTRFTVSTPIYNFLRIKPAIS
jgi:hypothetical protein